MVGPDGVIYQRAGQSPATNTVSDSGTTPHPSGPRPAPNSARPADSPPPGDSTAPRGESDQDRTRRAAIERLGRAVQRIQTGRDRRRLPPEPGSDDPANLTGRRDW